MENARVVKWLLKNFEAISGLMVNFDKSLVYGVNLSGEEMKEMANILGYKVGSWPIPYLGMKVCRRINGVEAWSY